MAIHELKCPACGAPLPQSGARITCDYCGSVLEREEPPEETEATDPPRPQEPHVVIVQQSHTVTSYRKKSRGGRCLSSLLIFALIGGVIGFIGWFGFREPLTTFFNQAGLSGIADLIQLPQQLLDRASVTTVHQIVLLPSGNDTGPDFLTFAYHADSSTTALTYVNAAHSTIRWQSPPLEEWAQSRILPSPEMLYVTDETTVYAFNRVDGQIVWQASLADELAASCRTCFELVENRLVALVAGGTVQGFDAQSGQLLWSERLNSESTGQILIVGDDLFIFDRAEDKSHDLMRVIDPVTGESQGDSLLLNCAGESIGFYQIRLYNPNRAELYLVNPGDSSDPPCIQIWDVAKQMMTQEILFNGLSLSVDASWIPQQAPVILANERLYITAEDGEKRETGVIVELNVADGQWHLVTEALDYHLIPLVTTEGILIVQATRRRGTERREVWGIDLASGETRWQRVLEASRWYEERGTGGVWDWRLTATGVAILQVLSDPDQITLEILNPQTGVSDGQKIIPITDRAFRDIAWTDDAVWIALHQIHKIDLASGTLTYTWP